MVATTKTWGGQALPLDGNSLRTNVIFNSDCINGMSQMPDESVFGVPCVAMGGQKRLLSIFSKAYNNKYNKKEGITWQRL